MLNIIAFLVAGAFFYGGFYLFGLAFQVPESRAAWVFFAGIIVNLIALVIPINILSRRN
jgi:hypothetical protein